MGRRVVFLVWRDTGHPEGGGSELYVERIAAELARGGDDVTVCCAVWPGGRADEVREGVRYRRRGGRLTVYLHGLLHLLGAGRRADVVVDVQNGLPFWSRLVRPRRPVVVLVHHVHDLQWHVIYPGAAGRVGWWLESVAAPALYRGCRYVTVSEASRADLARLGAGRAGIDVVVNGVDLPPVAARPPGPDGALHLGVLCRLVPHKQVEHAIAVLATLAPAHPTLVLDVVGDGWWAPTLREAVAAAGVADRVRFHGHVPDARRDELLAGLHLLLAPSLKEGWGLSIVEAAAAGVPAVAYRGAGGTRDSVVDGVTGVLVDDPAGLVAATDALLRDPARRRALGDSARVRAHGFSWKETAARFDDVLAAVAPARPGR